MSEGFEETLLELVVKAYNVNENRNTEMAGRCEELRCYAYFVDRVRHHEVAEKKRDPSLDMKAINRIALKKAIQDCKNKSLLVDFWDKLSPEEVNMLGVEWDMNIAMEVEREECYEKGRVTEREEIARNMLKKGFSCEQTAELSGLDIKRAKELFSDI